MPPGMADYTCDSHTTAKLQRANYTTPRDAGITLCETARIFSLIMKSAAPK